MFKPNNPTPPKWAKYVVEQKNGEIWCFEEGPYKREEEGVWRYMGKNNWKSERYRDFDNLYFYVDWDDNYPTLIKNYDPVLKSGNYGSEYKRKSNTDNDKLPEWAKYLAREENGELWCYEEYPLHIKDEGVWRPCSGEGEQYHDYDNVYWCVYWSDNSPTEISNYEQKERAFNKRNTNNYSTRENESKSDKPKRKLNDIEIYEMITGKPIWY